MVRVGAPRRHLLPIQVRFPIVQQTQCATVACFIGLAGLPSACTLVSAEAEVKEACITRTDITIEPAPELPSVEKSIAIDDLGSLGELADLADELEFLRFGARSMTAYTDLGFVEAASVAIASGDPNSTLPPLVVYDCAGDCALDGTTLSVDAQPGTDAVPYIRDKSLVVDLAFRGTMPTRAIRLTIDVCVTGSFSYEFAP